MRFVLKRRNASFCGLYMADFKILQEMGVVSEKKEGLFVIDYKQQYDKYIGLRIDNNWANEVLIQ